MPLLKKKGIPHALENFPVLSEWDHLSGRSERDRETLFHDFSVILQRTLPTATLEMNATRSHRNRAIMLQSLKERIFFLPTLVN